MVIFAVMVHKPGANRAADSFAALGHPVRLRIFRLLVRAGEDGANVGAIGRELDLPASTLAHHLHALVAAGLVRQERRGREVVSRADYDAMAGLVNYLTEECCADAEGRRGEAA